MIRVRAEDEAEATDKVIEAIFTAGVGEIPGWCAPPPSFEEKRLQQAAPDLLAACHDVLRFIENYEAEYQRLPYSFYEKNQLRAAIAKAENI